MNSYELMINPATFGTVANELHNPITDVHYVLHVRNRSLLASLAEHLMPFTAPGRATPSNLPALLSEPLRAGTVLVSSWQPIDLPESGQFIPTKSIPRRARCDVIYLPPFYLVHTPGLFEGTLAKATLDRKPETHEHAVRPRPFKF